MSRLAIHHKFTAVPVTPPPNPELSAIRPLPALAPINLDIDWTKAVRAAKPMTMAQYCPNIGYVDVAINQFKSPGSLFRFDPATEPDWPLWTVTVTVASPRTISVHMPSNIRNDIGDQQTDDNTMTLWYRDELWDFYNFPITSSIDYTNRRVTVQAAWKLSNSLDSGWSPNPYPSKVGSRAAGCHAAQGYITKDDFRFAAVNGYFPHALLLIGPSSAWADVPVSPARPATNVDSHHATSYTGRTAMGRLWGLDPAWPVPTNWSNAGKWTAETGKRKGFYIVDSTGGLTTTVDINFRDPVTQADIGGLVSNRELTTIISNCVELTFAKPSSMVPHA